jgi:hypothetical protein
LQFYFKPPYVAPEDLSPASATQHSPALTSTEDPAQTGGQVTQHSSANDDSSLALGNQERRSILRRLLGLPQEFRSRPGSSDGLDTISNLEQGLGNDVLEAASANTAKGSSSQEDGSDHSQGSKSNDDGNLDRYSSAGKVQDPGNTGASTVGYTPGVLSAVYFSDRPADMVLPQEFARRVGLGHTQVREPLILWCCDSLQPLPANRSILGQTPLILAFTAPLSRMDGIPARLAVAHHHHATTQRVSMTSNSCSGGLSSICCACSAFQLSWNRLNSWSGG